jgi:UDP-N-acetylmuramate dehydrogenase
LHNIEQDKNLINFNTFGFRAIAQSYLAVKSESELSQVMRYVKQQGLSYQVLSGGSNLLISKLVTGLTLHMQIKGITVVEDTEEHICIEAGAGENWHEFVEYCVKNNWQGVENLALIPGLVGASPVQNIGAYGAEIKDVLVSLKAYDFQKECYIELVNKQCDFAYRHSIFKHANGRYLITAVRFKLNKRPTINVKYKALQDYIDQNIQNDIGIKDVFDAVCAVRASKLPDPSVIANAGSFFKNPCITKQRYDQLLANEPNIVGFPISEKEVKLAAGWLIDQCGWKGFSKQGVGVYEKQALVLIHTGGATIDDLLDLAKSIQQSVFDRFSVELEIEPQPFPLKH